MVDIPKKRSSKKKNIDEDLQCLHIDLTEKHESISTKRVATKENLLQKQQKCYEFPPAEIGNNVRNTGP